MQASRAECSRINVEIVNESIYQCWRRSRKSQRFVNVSVPTHEIMRIKTRGPFAVSFTHLSNLHRNVGLRAPWSAVTTTTDCCRIIKIVTFERGSSSTLNDSSISKSLHSFETSKSIWYQNLSIFTNQSIQSTVKKCDRIHQNEHRTTNVAIGSSKERRMYLRTAKNKSHVYRMPLQFLRSFTQIVPCTSNGKSLFFFPCFICVWKLCLYILLVDKILHFFFQFMLPKIHRFLEFILCLLIICFFFLFLPNYGSFCLILRFRKSVLQRIDLKWSACC